MIENDGNILEKMKTKKFVQRVIPKVWGKNGPNITATSLPDDFFIILNLVLLLYGNGQDYNYFQIGMNLLETELREEEREQVILLMVIGNVKLQNILKLEMQCQ
jgi:hypothetical protein